VRRIAAAAAVLLAACSSNPDPQGGDDVVTPDASPEGWETLIESSWTLPPGEDYYCQRLTVGEDVWIKNFRSTIPDGHHHAVLTIDPDGGGGADGLFPCLAEDNFTTMIYGSAPGTEDIAMPDGVAVKVPAGAQLNLNLHLFNTRPSGDLAGTSIVLYQPVPPDQIDEVTEAEVVLMGPVGFTVDEGADEITGGCTMTADATLFMTNPHMHKLGTHAHVVARRAAGDVELHDGPYSFAEQRFYDTGLVPVADGDRVEITCTYDNDTGGPVQMGDSTTEEMCFATTYRYPPASGGAFGAICPF